MNNYLEFYQDFENANPELIHMTGHSHHYWPDITKAAIEEAYSDSMKFTDKKWDKIFSQVVPKSQELISKIINYSRPNDIAFAPNTHELLYRVISCLGRNKKRILTSKHEFHSANRQFQRLNEEDDFEIDFIEVEDIQSSLEKNQYDLVYFSHVFFDSGLKLSNESIEKIIELKNDALFLLDGYHSFCALPVDISKYENDLFFIAGSYKYAQAGEGLCFMTLPKNCELRPKNTGWFASFETLEKDNSEIQYSKSGLRFSGATRDFTPHYRFNYVWGNFFQREINISTIDQYVKSLQTEFLHNLNNTSKIIETDLEKIGHFITFKTQSNAESKDIHEQLLDLNILTDFRGNNLRFGFGMYLTKEKVNSLTKTLNKLNFFNKNA